MKFLKALLAGKKGEWGNAKLSKEKCGGGDGNSHATSCVSKESRSEKKKKSGKNNKKTRPSVVLALNSIRQAESLIRSWNSSDGVEERMDEYCGDEANVVFEDVPPISARQLAEIAVNILLPSFPDLSFSYNSVAIVDGNPKVVCVDDLVCTGTHTGMPYSIPGAPFPPIEATGAKCVNDPERVILHLDDSDDRKIKKLEIIALGNVSGLVGLYEQTRDAMLANTNE